MASHCLSASSGPDLPPIEQVIRRISLIAFGLLSPSPNFSPLSHRPLRTPQFSALGLASLLFGISSTLMLFGSFAFMLGFMLMPLIVVVMVVFCVGSLLASLTAPGIGFGAWGDDTTVRAKRGFEP